MRIAQISPLFESVPPRRYGGTERVVHWLTEELVRRGHEVVLFASGDSETSAALMAMCDRNLREAGSAVDGNALHAAALRIALEASPPFDLIHSHVDWVGLAMRASCDVPVVSTLHGRLDLPEIQAVAGACPQSLLVSISNAQRLPLPHARWVGTVPHGLPIADLPFVAEPDDYLAFVGRISPEKRPDVAIRVARAAGIPLRIAAKINGNPSDAEYWERVVRPLIDEGDGVEFVGEIGDEEKPDFMGRARALLFPVDWPEPFGLVAIESMAFGTPVITTPRGALPEIVENGRTGFLAESEVAMIAAVRSVDRLDRMQCRRDAERRFCVERMADDYEEVFRTVLGAQRSPRSADGLADGVF